MEELNPVDQRAVEMINMHAIPGFDGFFQVFTHLGSATFWLLALIAYLMVGKSKLIAIIFIMALLYGTVINEDIKNLISRERPEGAIVGASLTPVNYSFPSQHAQTAFMLATLSIAYFGLRYGLITYTFATLIAFSRMYLGVHYLTDVAAGAAIGIVIGELIMLALYLNGVTKNTGLTGYIARLAGIRPPVAPASGHQKLVGLIIILTGITISGIAMLAGQFAVSLAFIALVYLSVLKLPFLYAIYKT